MNKKIFNAMVFFIVAVMAVSCKQDPVSPDPDPKPHQDTSKFIGTWAMVFDTSDSAKKDFWWTGTSYYVPDTVTYVNDTLSLSRRGLEGGYYYTKDSLYSYDIVSGKGSATGSKYYLKNDTLVFDPDSTQYVPIYTKVK